MSSWGISIVGFRDGGVLYYTYYPVSNDFTISILQIVPGVRGVWGGGGGGFIYQVLYRIYSNPVELK